MLLLSLGTTFENFYRPGLLCVGFNEKKVIFNGHEDGCSRHLLPAPCFQIFPWSYHHPWKGLWIAGIT